MMKPRLKTTLIPTALRVVRGHVLITYLVVKFRGDTLVSVSSTICVL